MPDHYHTIVWIDHQEAKVFHLGREEADEGSVRSTHPHEHLHHKANSTGSGHAPVDHAFLERVVQAVSGSGAILITGPASAKDELAAHLRLRHPNLAKLISAVETVDHPTDGQLIALARKFFRADDRMHFQSARQEKRESGH
jgi:hypothetical protein